MTPPLPLAGVRIIDMADGRGELTGRYLADLGADVIRVEPPGGAASRGAAPLHDGLSLAFAARNANKRSVVLDLADGAGRTQLRELLSGADVWIEAMDPGALAGLGLDPTDVLVAHPGLTILSITDFGQDGPYRDWAATDPVHLAMAGVLCRSGLPGREPLLPPPGLATETTAIQAAWAAVLGHWQRLRTGRGGHIDFSIFEATAQIVDPAMGTVGTATSGSGTAARGRPPQGFYPIFPCADGHVRLVILAPRQWRAMRAWLGDPADLQDPELDTIWGRAAIADDLHRRYAELVRDRGKHELTAEGQARGVPIAPVLTLRDVVAAEHYRLRGAIADVELAPGVTAALPTGFVELDGRRAGFRTRAPRPGEHQDEVLAEGWIAVRGGVRPSPAGAGDDRPLAGVRVLDLGVIVMGAEIARLLADQGADVIKVESRDNPDGARVSAASFAIGHRGSRSLGLDLRAPEGVAAFKALVARSDVLLSNFKPGTLEKLGLGYDDLAEVNDRLVMVSSSAVGATGPWHGWMGYGPLVRCAAGITSLWLYPDDPEGFSDGTTIYPDHFAARVGAVALLAGLIARDRSGRGMHIRSSQAEAILTQMSDLVAAESLAPGSITAPGNGRSGAAPWGVYPCAGDDEWCVVTVRDDADWLRLRDALGDPEWARGSDLRVASGRRARRVELDRHLSAWTAARTPRAVAAELQAAGVPAGFMQRAAEYPDDAHLTARGFLTTMEQPGQEPKLVERAPFKATNIPDPEIAPAPEMGQHTREIARDLLGLDDEDVERLLEAGVLQEAAAPVAT